MTASAQGLDVSSWNPPLSAAMIAGKTFVIAKATEALGFIDPSFAHNWKFLAGQPVHRGAYHFFHPSLDPAGQAAFFLAVVDSQGLSRGDMLIADVEIASGVARTLIMADAPGRSGLLRRDARGRARIMPGVRYPHRVFNSALPPKMAAADVDLGAREFLDAVSTGVRTILGGDYCPVLCYTYQAFLPQLNECTPYPLWIADYSPGAPQSVMPWTDWRMWQWSGGGGPGNADRDAYNGTAAAMSTWIASYTGTPAPAPSPAANWETAMINALPTLKEGAKDAPGQVEFVHRVQWMCAGLATVRTIAAATGLPADGDFGPKTTAAVKGVQASFGLTQDGIVGPGTWGVLYTGAPA